MEAQERAPDLVGEVCTLPLSLGQSASGAGTVQILQDEKDLGLQVIFLAGRLECNGER